jgi:hypothetical protein
MVKLRPAVPTLSKLIEHGGFRTARATPDWNGARVVIQSYLGVKLSQAGGQTI